MMKRGLAIVLIAVASCMGCGKIKSMVSPIDPIEAWVAKGAGGIGEMEYYLYLHYCPDVAGLKRSKYMNIRQ